MSQPFGLVFECKNQATAQGLTKLLTVSVPHKHKRHRHRKHKVAPVVHERELKVAQQVFKNGKAVFTIITSDLSYPRSA